MGDMAASLGEWPGWCVWRCWIGCTSKRFHKEEGHQDLSCSIMTQPAGANSLMHIHLTMVHDSTYSMHCLTWQHGIFSDTAISIIDGHLWTGRDDMLTAHITFIHQFSIAQLKAFNPFHVYMYISHWGQKNCPPV